MPPLASPAPAFQAGRLELGSPLCLHSPKPCTLGAGITPCTVMFLGDQCPKQHCPREPGQHQDIRVLWHRACHPSVCLAKPNPCQASSMQWGLLSCAAQCVVPHGFENSLRKTRQYGLGSCPGTSSRSPPRCSLLAAPEIPGPIGVWLHGMGSEGGRGQALGWPRGHHGAGAGGHPQHPQRRCLVATATLSGLRRSIPQHPAARGSGPRRGHGPALPTQPPLRTDTPGCPHTLPTVQQPQACLCRPPGRRGTPPSSQGCPEPTQPAGPGGLACGGVHRPWK